MKEDAAKQNEALFSEVKDRMNSARETAGKVSEKVFIGPIGRYTLNI